MLGPSAYLLVAGASLPASLADRIPTWLFGAAAVTSLAAVVWRFAPDVLSPLGSNLEFSGGTFDHPVILAGFTAAAVAAAATVRLRRAAWFVPLLILISTALSVSAKRSGLLAVAVGLAVALWRGRPGRSRALLVTGVVAGTLVAWTVGSAFAPADEPLSGVQRFQQLDSDSASARVHIAGAMVRAWEDRPILGWGVGNAWPAYLANATPADVEVAHRGIADPHNIVLGSAATTGLVGLVALLALVGVVARRAWRAPRRLGWAVGAAAALFVSHLLQPLNASLTPLLFLLAGVAAASTLRARPSGVRLGRLGRGATGVLLSAGLALSVLLLASSVLMQWGRTYNSTWSLRAAADLAPTRVWALQTLAVYRAQDAATGDAVARRETEGLVDRLVREHPWYPDARMTGVHVGLSMNDADYARAWMRRQFRVFPSDLASLTPAGLEFYRTGVRPGFDEYVQAEPASSDLAGASGG
jgi:O-antigen ligase